MTTIIAHAGISDITPEQAQQLGWIGLILAFTVPAAVTLLAAYRSPVVVCLSIAQIIALFYSLRAISRYFIRRGWSGFRYVAMMYSAYALVCCVTNVLWIAGLFSIGAAWNRLAPPSLNALQENSSVRHGSCFRRRLSAHRAGAGPLQRFSELGAIDMSAFSPQ